MKARVSLLLRSILVFGLVMLLTVVFGPGEVRAQAKTFQLKYAGFTPKGNAMEVTPEWWSKEVEKRTGGRVKVNLYFAESLGKLFDQPKMLRGGICDITQLPDVSPEFPSLAIFSAPYVVPNSVKNMEVFWVLYYKGLLKELNDYKVLWWQPTDPMYMILRKKKVTKMEEFKGLKLRGMPGFRAAFNEALGATGVSMPTAETYLAFERGIIDGMSGSVDYCVPAKMYEVTKYWIWEPFNTGGVVAAMNLNVWNSLPPDIQVTMEELNREARYRYMEGFKTPSENRALLKKLGWDVYEISSEERAQWRAVAKPVVEKWVTEKEAKGLPARQIVDTIKQFMESYE